jgi:hypothetical protein
MRTAAARRFASLVGVVLAASGMTVLEAQQPRQSPAPATAQSRPAIDLVGTWVAIVTEDWRWRMVTPARGDYASLPLNAEGRKVAGTWDLSRDIAQGQQCRPFGVGNISRMPGRIRIAWQDPQTLKLEYDAGTQTRLLRFDPSQKPPSEKTWQGWSVAAWEYAPGDGPGSLKVVTTGMRAGYLRKNGVPYSDAMAMTEYYDRHSEENGDQWFTVTTVVEDPRYLNEPFITTTHFRKEADGSKWHQTPCAIDPPLK